MEKKTNLLFSFILKAQINNANNITIPRMALMSPKLNNSIPYSMWRLKGRNKSLAQLVTATKNPGIL